MKLKYILNILLSLIALSSICTGIFQTTELSLKCVQFAISITCIGAVLTKKHRYIFMTHRNTQRKATLRFQKFG